MFRAWGPLVCPEQSSMFWGMAKESRGRHLQLASVHLNRLGVLSMLMVEPPEESLSEMNISILLQKGRRASVWRAWSGTVTRSGGACSAVPRQSDMRSARSMQTAGKPALPL